MRKNLFFISSTLLGVLFLSMSIFAQSQFGEISGTVSDPNGAVVPNATVTVTGVSVGLTKTATTDSNGFYAFRQLPPGTYNVSVAAVSGFAAKEIKGQTVILETSTPVNITLNVAGGTATVDVTGNELVAPVDATESKVQTSVTAAKIELLPKGNDFTSVLKTAPGTRGEGRAGGYSVDGASGSENVFIIDGQEVTNFRTGTLNGNNAIPNQFVQEVQIKSSGFEAEFGGATGGVINVVTKGGSNAWRGEFGSNFETTKLNGGRRPILSRFTNGSGASFLQTYEYNTFRKQDGHNWFPTANLNGPIIKDKLWFSGSYSPQTFSNNYVTDFYTAAPRTALGTLPARSYRFSERYAAESKFEYAFARLDAQPWNSVRLSSTFLWNPQINTGVLPFDTASFGGTPASLTLNGTTYTGADLYSRQGGRQTANNFTAQGSWTPTSNFIFSSRYSRGFLNQKGNNYFVFSGTRYICSAGNANIPSACPTGAGDPANSLTKFDVSVRTNWEADATYFLNFSNVRNEIKGGYQRFRVKNDVNLGYADTGVLQFYYDRNIADLGAPVTVSPTAIGAGTLTRFGTFGTGENTNQSIYIQDKIQFGGRFTLNAGVRFEKEDLPAFNSFAPPINFGWGDKIAPRFGASYALNKRGTAKVFGSYGKFFDRLKFELPRGSFGGDFYRVDFFEIFPGQNWRTSFNKASVVGSFSDAPGGACPTTGFIASGAQSRCQYDYRIASNNPNASIEDGKVDPNLHPFQQDEWTVGYQQELSRNYVLSSRFTYKDVKWAVEDAGVRNNAGSEAYILGNPGSGLHLQLLQSLGYTKSVKPQRNYKGWDISLDKRLSNNYYFNLNYTWSRLYGNYSGLASSDENGRTSPGVNRFFDLPFLGFTADGHPDNGLLATDRTHVFNAYGAYIFDWKGSKHHSTSFSGYQTFQSGTPQTTFITYITAVIYTNRGDLGRAPMLTQTDFSMSHKYTFGRDNRFSIVGDLNILNLWDEKNVLTVQNTLSGTTMNASTFGLSEVAGTNAFTAGTLKPNIVSYLQGVYGCSTAGTCLNRSRSDINQPNGYQGPRTVRFGLRFLF